MSTRSSAKVRPPPTNIPIKSLSFAVACSYVHSALDIADANDQRMSDEYVEIECFSESTMAVGHKVFAGPKPLSADEIASVCNKITGTTPDQTRFDVVSMVPIDSLCGKKISSGGRPHEVSFAPDCHGSHWHVSNVEDEGPILRLMPKPYANAVLSTLSYLCRQLLQNQHQLKGVLFHCMYGENRTGLALLVYYLVSVRKNRDEWQQFTIEDFHTVVRKLRRSRRRLFSNRGTTQMAFLLTYLWITDYDSYV
jgi:hypothetical protein